MNKTEQLKLIVTTPPQVTPETQVSRYEFANAKIKNSNKKPDTCECNFAKLLCFICSSSGVTAGGFCMGGLVNTAIQYDVAISLASVVGMGAMTGGLCSVAGGIAGYQVGKCIDLRLKEPKGTHQNDISEDRVPLMLEDIDTDTE